MTRTDHLAKRLIRLPTRIGMAIARFRWVMSVMALLLVFQNLVVRAEQAVPVSMEAPAGMQILQSEDDAPQPTLITDIVYAEYETGPVRLHLISPGVRVSRLAGTQAVGDPLPWILYVPGSAWFPQNLARAIPNMIDFVKQTGFAIAIAAYRPSTMAIAPAQLVDMKAAIRFLRANADSYNLDPARVAIWGTSSGGHMASLVGLTAENQAFANEVHNAESDAVRAVVNFFGPTDFRRMNDYPSVIDHDAPTSPESVVVGGPIQDPRYRDKVNAYNPMTYVEPSRRAPPFLIMHGDRDALVPFNQSVLLYEALRDAGQDVSFYKVAGAGHGDRFFTPSTLAVVTAFLKQHLAP